MKSNSKLLIALIIACCNPAFAQIETHKSDFLPGDLILFSDSLFNEKIGEFPSKWDLVSGSAEIAGFDGSPVIAFAINQTKIKPLFNKKEFLPEQFTLEFEIYFHNAGNEGYYLRLQTTKTYEIRLNIDNVMYQRATGRAQLTKRIAGWRKIAVSFHKRALKVYLNGERLQNIPNFPDVPKHFELAALSHGSSKNKPAMIRNIRLAEGGIPLYERLVTDGKFSLHDITFEVNKAQIKTESQPSLERIAALLQEHPEVKIRIHGHTDSDGDEAFNLQLSTKRAEAIKQALVELGVGAARLEIKAWGESKPVHSNDTSEGKMRNRRVEFELIK